MQTPSSLWQVIRRYRIWICGAVVAGILLYLAILGGRIRYEPEHPPASHSNLMCNAPCTDSPWTSDADMLYVHPGPASATGIAFVGSNALLTSAPIAIRPNATYHFAARVTQNTLTHNDDGPGKAQVRFLWLDSALN